MEIPGNGQQPHGERTQSTHSNAQALANAPASETQHASTSTALNGKLVISQEAQYRFSLYNSLRDSPIETQNKLLNHLQQSDNPLDRQVAQDFANNAVREQAMTVAIQRYLAENPLKTNDAEFTIDTDSILAISIASPIDIFAPLNTDDQTPNSSLNTKTTKFLERLQRHLQQQIHQMPTPNTPETAVNEDNASRYASRQYLALSDAIERFVARSHSPIRTAQDGLIYGYREAQVNTILEHIDEPALSQEMYDLVQQGKQLQQDRQQIFNNERTEQLQREQNRYHADPTRIKALQQQGILQQRGLAIYQQAQRLTHPVQVIEHSFQALKQQGVPLDNSSSLVNPTASAYDTRKEQFLADYRLFEDYLKPPETRPKLMSDEQRQQLQQAVDAAKATFHIALTT